MELARIVYVMLGALNAVSSMGCLDPLQLFRYTRIPETDAELIRLGFSRNDWYDCFFIFFFVIFIDSQNSCEQGPGLASIRDRIQWTAEIPEDESVAISRLAPEGVQPSQHLRCPRRADFAVRDHRDHKTRLDLLHPSRWIDDRIVQEHHQAEPPPSENKRRVASAAP